MMKMERVKIRKARRNKLRAYSKILGVEQRMEILLAIDAKGRVSVRDILDWLEKQGMGSKRTTVLRRLDEMVEKGVLVRENGRHGSKGWYSINEVNEENREFLTFMYGNMSAKVNPYHRNYIKQQKMYHLLGDLSIRGSEE